MAESNDWGSSVVKPVFTNGGNNIQTPKPGTSTLKPSLSSSSSRGQGWSAHGIKRFNKLYVLVEKERMSSFGSQFKENYMQPCITAREKGTKNKILGAL